ncbi:hypothetical protein [Pelagicoccus mobilis]|uniref:HTTM domain-containing protein n=1 Tax=Pelagicoccus mobilis TaxID=415221 RepID=A0A934RXX2_9BACT|nr:hypothetical protein [Pelagicoccus mobilis]MBK1875904.1 hypothetical protein [Pelagicoccus mobilis]
MLHAAPSESYANLVRITVFGIWILKFVFDPIQDLSVLPLSVFSPPFPLNALPPQWHNVLLSWPALITIKCVGALSCLACFNRKLIPAAGPIASLCVILYQCLVRGFGHVNHAEVIALIAVLVYTCYSFSKSKQSHPEPFAITLLLCLSYTLIGAHRFITGGSEIFLSDTVLFWAENNSKLTSYFDFNLGTSVAHSPFLALGLKAGFLWITIWEFIAPLTLIFSKLRIPFLVSILGFHLSVLLTMNILFWENTVLLAVLFVPAFRKTEKS